MYPNCTTFEEGGGGGGGVAANSILAFRGTNKLGCDSLLKTGSP